MLVSCKNTIFLVAVQYLFLVILWGLEGEAGEVGNLWLFLLRTWVFF